MATSPTCIIAYTREDGGIPEVRRAAMDIARTANARLILYDIDAAPRTLAGVPNPLDGVPQPTEWSGDGDDNVGETPFQLGPDELERMGRHALADQVRQARGAGVNAFGWLPSKRNADELATYSGETGADLIVVPSELDHGGLMARLRGETLEKVVDKSEAAVAVVYEDGRIDYPQGEGHEEAASLEASQRDRAGRN